MTKTKEVKTYPASKNFTNLLNYQWSMTKELIKLHNKFSVELISSSINNDLFVRQIFLRLDHTRVIAAASSTAINNQFFLDLLSNAQKNPIGEVIFAPNSRIIRENMNIELINQQVNVGLANLIESLNYAPQQKLWCRTSIFRYNEEQLNLTEILLPELSKFIK